MPIIQSQSQTFDTVAPLYARMRPGYPDELYDMIFSVCPLDETKRAVEVGIGGGQATLPILRTGCAVDAVEPGVNFCRLADERFAEFPKFSTINAKFEDKIFPDESYDLVYSAAAFHWVPQDIGYARVYKMLKKGGVFARFANHPWRDKGNKPLANAVNAAYRRYYDKFYGYTTPSEPTEYTEAEAAARADFALGYGFTDVKYALFYRTRSFTADEYVDLISTYSDHIAIDEPIRSEFFSAVHDAIADNGGIITLYDTLDLQLAIK